MAAAHASSLPSVGAAMAALRKAHTAVQNLAAAQAPQRQASEQPWTSEVASQPGPSQLCGISVPTWSWLSACH